MKSLVKLATSLIFLAGTILTSGSLVHADENRAVGIVAINYSGTTITSLSSAVAVGKTSAAGTASINGSETSASAVAGSGVLTVTNRNSTSVSYQMDGESIGNLGTISTAPQASQQVRVDNIDGINKSVTVVIP
ncbi:hypothetical protein [Chamaesiphon sp. GL140_3_metabinner_50]|uniref:hypothetical protein n=1 Tax=Chamaesiphon sp. GL140_3_metabinner_50 TaxID=2970812 RepID=UPI0025E91B55|nr:hypothetical protein [Chamaesiphon sp. GL140_3_metabinner_50]